MSRTSNEMVSAIWGPPFWHILHTISFNYPITPTDNDKNKYYNFFSSLPYILPCKRCRENLKNNYKYNLPLTMEVFKNRHTLSLYIYQLHELVNESLNKVSNLSYKDVKRKYEYFRVK